MLEDILGINPLELAKTMLREVNGDNELFELAARANRKAYDALMNEGFSPDQAIQIVAAQGAVNLKANGVG